MSASTAVSPDSTAIIPTFVHLNESDLAIQIASMNYNQLSSACADGLEDIGNSIQRNFPYFEALKELLAHQGQRSDIQQAKGVPVGMTWTRWVEEHKSRSGSLSSLRRMFIAAKQKQLAAPAKVLVVANETDRPVDEAGEIVSVDDEIVTVKCNKASVGVIKVTKDDVMVIAPVRVIHLKAAGVLVMTPEDGGTEYSFDGGHKLIRTQTPTVGEEKRREAKEKREANAESLRISRLGDPQKNFTKATKKRSQSTRRKDARKAAAANPAPKVSGSLLGLKSEPIDGLYWEGVKDAKKPYAIKDANNPHLGILHSCGSQSVADAYIAARSREGLAEIDAMKTDLDALKKSADELM